MLLFQMHVISGEVFLHLGTQGCQVLTTKPAQLLLKTSPIMFKGSPPLKIAFWSGKIHIFGGVPLVKFAFQGLNITLLGSLQPMDIKNKVAHLATMLARELMGTHTANSERNKTHGNYLILNYRNSCLTERFNIILRIVTSLIDR